MRGWFRSLKVKQKLLATRPGSGEEAQHYLTSLRIFLIEESGRVLSDARRLVNLCGLRTSPTGSRVAGRRRQGCVASGSVQLCRSIVSADVLGILRVRVFHDQRIQNP